MNKDIFMCCVNLFLLVATVCHVPRVISYKFANSLDTALHGLQSLPPSPKRAERKGRGRPFWEAGSGHKQWNTVSCVDTFSIISKFSVQNSKI